MMAVFGTVRSQAAAVLIFILIIGCLIAVPDALISFCWNCLDHHLFKFSGLERSMISITTQVLHHIILHGRAAQYAITPDLAVPPDFPPHAGFAAAAEFHFRITPGSRSGYSPSAHEKGVQ